ncbi:hypothetical protein ACIPC1_39445 [Streptomyces sp. NPDC087263]|uniref:hypothetical protein n=1 Tax=Streptomyces sp. NPDC087263 TaxID=3365773 RepID=UPI00381834E9
MDSTSDGLVDAAVVGEFMEVPGLLRLGAERGGDEQRAAWDAQQLEWRRLAAVAQASITEHAKAAQQSRDEFEAALRKLVRHPDTAAG